MNAKEDKADIGGWVTIDNYSGKKYTNAKLKLIAGEVNKVSSGGGGQFDNGLKYAKLGAVALSAPSFE